MIETFAGNDGHIDEKEFKDAVTTMKKQTQGKKTDVQCKRMVVEIIEDNAFKVKQGMFHHWYDVVKKEVGMSTRPSFPPSANGGLRAAVFVSLPPSAPVR